MEKKYELTDDVVIYHGCTLHRIKALKDFGDVEKGELGGYVESEKNLSQEGNCWIYDEAKVFYDARVSDDAIVVDEAKVFDDARISGNARVSEYAQVFDNAKVSGNAVVPLYAEISGNTKVGTSRESQIPITPISSSKKMNDFIEDLQDRYNHAKQTKINEFIKEHKNSLDNLQDLMRYSACLGRTKVNFTYNRKNKPVVWHDFLISSELQDFVFNYWKLIQQATGLEIKVYAYAHPQIEISFLMVG